MVGHDGFGDPAGEEPAEIVTRDLFGNSLEVFDKLARDRDKLMTAYYAEAIDTEMLKREHGRIRLDSADMEAQLEAATPDLREQTSSIELAMELLDAMAETYERASEEVRRQFNRALFDRIVDHEEGVDATLNEPFRQLLEPSGSRWTGSVDTIVHSSNHLRDLLALARAV
jgi:hypothetical protein